jgi:hypothetical protein
MKYRAGHGEEAMTPRSQVYCNRARTRLAALNSKALEVAVATAPEPAPAPRPTSAAPAAVPAKRVNTSKVAAQPKAVYARYRQGTAAASRAYWAAHEARVSRIKARIEAKWKRVASR